MASHLNTVTVTSYTFEFTEQELQALKTAIGTCTSPTVVGIYKKLKETLELPQEG